MTPEQGLACAGIPMRATRKSLQPKDELSRISVEKLFLLVWIDCRG